MNTLILGRRGLGKSTLAVWRARQLSKHIVAWSPGAEFRAADLHITARDELLDFMDSASDDEEEEQPYFVEYIADGDLEENFDRFARVLWKFGDYALIVDEANELQTPASINPMLARFIRRAPRREKGDENPIDIIQTSHFPVDFHRISFGLADEAFIFRLTRLRDWERIRDEFGEAVAQAVDQAKTPETDPEGRDVIHLNVVTEKFQLMQDPDEWNEGIRETENE